MKYRKDLKLNWKQVKKKYPKLKPYSDTDFDGTLNKKDCKPLNPFKDQLQLEPLIASRLLGQIAGTKVVGIRVMQPNRKHGL